MSLPDTGTPRRRTRAVVVLGGLVGLAIVVTVSVLVATHHSGSKRASTPSSTRASVLPPSTRTSVTGPAGTLVPRSIDATGKADVTDALNAYLARVPNGATIVFRANGRYRIEGTLSLSNRKNITIEGQGATFFATTNGLSRPVPGCDRSSSVCRYPNRTRSQWSFAGDTNLVVREVKVIGSDRHSGPSGTYDASLEAQHAFQILGGSGIVLNHVNAQDSWGDLVYVGVQLGRKNGTPTNVMIENSTFRGASRMGFSVTNGEHVTFANNSLDSVRRSLIDLEANTSTDLIAYITIRDNQLGHSRFCAISNYGAPGIEHDFVISDNHFMGSAPIKICVQATRTARRSNYTISGNVGATRGQVPNEPIVSVAYIDHVTVDDNVQGFSTAWPQRGSPQAPVMANCSTVAVTANRFTPRPAGMPEYIAKPC